MANSGTVTAGSAALASQYNNLRDDVLSISTGHTHTGASENGAKVAATGVASGTAANGAVLTADGSGAAAFLAAGASGGILKYEEFTSSGSFVIPASASSSAIVVLDMLSPGNGGNSGRVRGAGTATHPGAGGMGGRYKQFVALASAFGTAGGTVTVTIGAGGAGGTGTTSTANSGVLGAAGGLTSFGTVNLVPPPQDGFGSQRGPGQYDALSIGAVQQATRATSGTVLFDANFNWSEGAGGFADNGSSSYVGYDSGLVGAGGGSGGPITGADATVAGAVGGKRHGTPDGHLVVTGFLVGSGATGGTAGGGAGGTATSSAGGGGGSRTNGNGGVGGAGDFGCGGGGGGAARTPYTSGAGGAGGGGRVRVWVIG